MSFVVNPTVGTMFSNKTELSRFFILSPYIVYEDESKTILSSKSIDNVYIFNGDGELEDIYTVPGSGVTYFLYEDNKLYAYESGEHILYTIDNGSITQVEDEIPSSERLEMYQNPYSGNAKVRINLLKQIVYVNENGEKNILYTNYSYMIIFMILYSTILVLSGNFAYQHERKRKIEADEYIPIFKFVPNKILQLLIILSMIILAYIFGG